MASYKQGTRLQAILGGDKTKVLPATVDERYGDNSLRWFCVGKKPTYPGGLGTVPVAHQLRGYLQKSCPEYTASKKKRPAREVRNSTDKQRSQLKHQKVESLPPSSSSSSFFTPSSLSSHSNPFGSYSSTSTASTTSAALSSDFSGASQRLVPPQPRVGDGYVRTSEARTQASLWLNAARPQARKAAAVELLRGLPAEDLQHVLKSFEHKRTSSSASTESNQVLDVAERIRSEAINYKESLLTLAEERQQRRRGEGLKESEIRGALLFVDAYGD